MRSRYDDNHYRRIDSCNCHHEQPGVCLLERVAEAAAAGDHRSFSLRQSARATAGVFHAFVDRRPEGEQMNRLDFAVALL